MVLWNLVGWDHKGGHSVLVYSRSVDWCFCCSFSSQWIWLMSARPALHLSLMIMIGLWMYPACMLQREWFYFKTHVCTITQHFHYPYPLFSLLMEFNEQRLANGPRVHCIGTDLVFHLCENQQGNGFDLILYRSDPARCVIIVHKDAELESKRSLFP